MVSKTVRLSVLILLLAIVGLTGITVYFDYPNSLGNKNQECLGGFESQDVSEEERSNIEPPENVILISADTLRADRLGTYSQYRNWAQERDTSPNIDKFAENSIVFDKAVTQAPWTFPAHVSIFTSTYARTHGLTGWEKSVPENYTLLAEVLREEGYRTAGFHGNMFLSKEYGFDQGFETYKVDSENENWNKKK